MISRYETAKTPELSYPGMYALGQDHKHLPEMTHIAGIEREPVFCPIVDDYYAGMSVTVPLHTDTLRLAHTADELRSAIRDHYAPARFVRVTDAPGGGTLHSDMGIGTNTLEITVAGSADRVTITSRLDNLGKGASGAAVQNMNIMLGFDEGTGL
jgi:N-acetyl-gamma-glutamyl-phosphate reductase